jgi:hypothetical protein
MIWLGDDHGSCYEAARAFNKTSTFDALATLLRNRYFSRLWIVQEILLARRIQVLVDGGVWVSWGVMRAIARKSKRYLREVNIPESVIRLLHQEPGAMSLTVCIDRFSGNLCQDPRDRVYGLLGLVKKDERLVVDYEKPTHKVFLDMLTTCCAIYAKSTRDEEPNSSTPVDYQYTLLGLSETMRLSTDQQLGLHSLLATVWGDQRMLSVDRLGKESSPITCAGYDLAASRKFSGHCWKPDQHMGPRDRWWYVFESRKYCHDCGDGAGSEYSESIQGSEKDDMETPVHHLLDDVDTGTRTRIAAVFLILLITLYTVFPLLIGD